LNVIKSCSQIDKSDYEEEEQNISKPPNETSNLRMRRRMAKFGSCLSWEAYFLQKKISSRHWKLQLERRLWSLEHIGVQVKLHSSKNRVFRRALVDTVGAREPNFGLKKQNSATVNHCH
jgi:hypothetical protein